MEDELAAKPSPAKRARKSAPTKESDDEFVPQASPAPPAAVASSSKANDKKAAAAEKKLRARVKKIFDQYVLIFNLSSARMNGLIENFE